METTDVETDVTKYDMDNHGPCISIEEDVKLTDDVMQQIRKKLMPQQNV